MPNHKSQGVYYSDESTGVLQNPPAKNKQQRRKTLDDLLAGVWANMDIGCIERIDDADDDEHGWIAFPWKKDPGPKADNPQIQ